jgi:hypothetical protein
MDQEKRRHRQLKRDVKKAGNRKRRQSLKRDLERNPEEAAHSEFDFGRDSSEGLNGNDHDSTRRHRNKREEEEEEE